MDEPSLSLDLLESIDVAIQQTTSPSDPTEAALKLLGHWLADPTSKTLGNNTTFITKNVNGGSI